MREKRCKTGPPVEPREHPPKPVKGGHRSFLWGFLLAIVLVGFISILMATFLLRQILEPGEKTAAAPSAVAESAITPETPLIAKAESFNPVPDPPINPSPAPSEEETTLLSPTEMPPVASPSPPVQPEAPLAQAAPQPDPEPEIHQQTTRVAPLPPDPDIINRLRELEIRGIMSGGTRVLIQDLSTGRTKAYQAGDALEGPMGIVVETITPSNVKFKDYAGSIHTKSF